MDLETCRYFSGHPSHRACVKVGVATSCEPQLLVHILIFLCSL